MNKISNTSKLFKIFIFFSWAAMWISINSMPGEINYMNRDIIAFSNGMRSIFALAFSFFTTIFAVYYLIFNKVQI